MADVVVGRDKCGEQRLVSLPLSRIRVIMKSSPEVSSINQEALVLTAKATVRRRPRGKEREDSGVGGRLKLSRCPVPVGPRAVGAPLRAHACATLREPTQFHAARASAPARPPSLCSALPAPLPSCLAHLSPRPPRSRPASRALRPAHPAPLPPALARGPVRASGGWIWAAARNVADLLHLLCSCDCIFGPKACPFSRVRPISLVSVPQLLKRSSDRVRAPYTRRSRVFSGATAYGAVRSRHLSLSTGDIPRPRSK